MCDKLIERSSISNIPNRQTDRQNSLTFFHCRGALKAQLKHHPPLLTGTPLLTFSAVDKESRHCNVVIVGCKGFVTRIGGLVLVCIEADIL